MGILVNIVPWEVPMPKTLGDCSPSGFWPWNYLGTIFTRIPSAFPHIVSIWRPGTEKKQRFARRTRANAQIVTSAEKLFSFKQFTDDK